jgi:hypothetical protein
MLAADHDRMKYLTIILGIIFLAPGTPWCATTESNTSMQQETQLVQRLRAAQQLDHSNALDVSVGPVAAGDYMLRADRAADVIDKIEHGARVSQAEIEDALFVPPKSLSETERAQLVQQLQHSWEQDQRGWYDWTRDPVIAQNFLVQGKKAKRVIRDLETNRPVSWADIDEAMQVPYYY